jgi:hypothetical protein
VRARAAVSELVQLRGGECASYFAENQAAEIKHSVIRIEKTIGKTKRYLQLTTVIAAKQQATAHPMPRMAQRLCYQAT